MRKLQVEEMNRLTVDEFKESEKFPFVILLDNIRSMNNIGSFFRTADAFRAEKIYLCGYTQHPPHREISRSALGADLSVHWEKAERTIDVVLRLKSEGFKAYAVEQVEGSIYLQNFIPDAGKPHAFIFGNEIDGVDQEVIAAVDGCIEIPQFGTKHSFNVSVSAGIVIWDYVSKNIL